MGGPGAQGRAQKDGVPVLHPERRAGRCMGPSRQRCLEAVCQPAWQEEKRATRPGPGGPTSVCPLRTMAARGHVK